MASDREPGSQPCRATCERSASSAEPDKLAKFGQARHASHAPQGRIALRRHAALGRTATRALVRHDPTLVEDLPTPDAGRFPPVDRAGEAGQSHRAALAQCLRALDVARGVGEPQVGVVRLARQAGTRAPARPDRDSASGPTGARAAGLCSPGRSDVPKALARVARRSAGCRRGSTVGEQDVKCGRVGVESVHHRRTARLVAEVVHVSLLGRSRYVDVRRAATVWPWRPAGSRR